MQSGRRNLGPGSFTRLEIPARPLRMSTCMVSQGAGPACAVMRLKSDWRLATEDRDRGAPSIEVLGMLAEVRS
eukprot:scaffold6436_cov113-Isochrysis_galbana.AAC.1